MKEEGREKETGAFLFASVGTKGQTDQIVPHPFFAAREGEIEQQQQQQQKQHHTEQQNKLFKEKTKSINTSDRKIKIKQQKVIIASKFSSFLVCILSFSTSFVLVLVLNRALRATTRASTHTLKTHKHTRMYVRRHTHIQCTTKMFFLD